MFYAHVDIIEHLQSTNTYYLPFVLHGGRVRRTSQYTLDDDNDNDDDEDIVQLIQSIQMSQQQPPPPQHVYDDVYELQQQYVSASPRRPLARPTPPYGRGYTGIHLSIYTASSSTCNNHDEQRTTDEYDR